MRIALLSLLIAVCTFSIACGRVYGPVEQATALMEAKDEMVNKWGKIIDVDPKESGVAEARKVFDSAKADLVAKRDAVVKAPQGINSDWSTNFSRHDGRVKEAISAIQIKIGVGGDPVAKDKFTALQKEFETAVSRY